MRLSSGGCSRVEYQRIGGPRRSVVCEYGAFFSSGEGVRGKRAGGLRGLLFGTLLGFEATGPVPFWGAGWLFRFSCMSLSGSCSVVFVPRGGFRGRGVTGLLFENYIVDASIL
jgi:hypothetical protein